MWRTIGGCSKVKAEKLLVQVCRGKLSRLPFIQITEGLSLVKASALFAEKVFILYF